MVWTYTDSPATSTSDELRFYIGDTDANDQQLTDAEVAFLLASYGGAKNGAIAACTMLAAKYARMVDRTIGALSISASQKSKAYQSLAKTLQSQFSLSAIPFAGGISISDKENRDSDTDKTPPFFWRDMDTVQPL